MYTTLTPAERERHAYASGLPFAEVFGQLADLSEADENRKGIDAHLDEARAQFPNEDFLCSVLDDLQGMAKRLRGDNRADLQRIIEALTEIQDSVARDSEYGVDELRKASAAL